MAPDIKQRIISHFEKSLELLHPFMPFITEELWQGLEERKAGQSICIQSYPAAIRTPNLEIIQSMEKARELVTTIRALKNQYKYGQRDLITLSVQMADKPFFETYGSLIESMAHLSAIESVTQKPAHSAVFVSGRDECFFPMGISADIDQEREKMIEELTYQEGFLQTVLSKLQNEGFVSRAPEKVIEMERKKQADTEARIAILKQNLGV